MQKKSGTAKVMENYAFRPAMSGLDENTTAFINSLIDQNSELINKLEHVDSLKQLADKTVLEARKEAAEIIAEAEKKAKTEARKILSRAKKQADKGKRKRTGTPRIEFNEQSISTSPDGRKMCCVLVTKVKRAAVQLADYLKAQGEAVHVRCIDETGSTRQLWEVWSSKYI